MNNIWADIEKAMDHCYLACITENMKITDNREQIEIAKLLIKQLHNHIQSTFYSDWNSWTNKTFKFNN